MVSSDSILKDEDFKALFRCLFGLTLLIIVFNQVIAQTRDEKAHKVCVKRSKTLCEDEHRYCIHVGFDSNECTMQSFNCLTKINKNCEDFLKRFRYDRGIK